MSNTSERSSACGWLQDDDGSDAWGTDCGRMFLINEGAPSQNHMKFCCYCGKPLVEHIYEPEAREPESDE